MSGIALALLFTAGLAILVSPRRWAIVALLAGTCYVTRAQAIELGPFTFTVVRILTAIGLLRVLLRNEWSSLRFRTLDLLVVAWGACLLISVTLHANPGMQVMERLGFVFDAWGVYFLVRFLCRNWEESAEVCRLCGIVLAPIAGEMLVEKATARNAFAVFGGVAEIPYIRQGHVRAQGPFAHAILAGTIGAVCLPLVLSAWTRHKKTALIGVVSCLVMVFASTSSGPILSAAAGVVALFLWRYRHRTASMRWGAVLAYLALDVVMNDPAYFILARIDLAGGSTGWHRARLIQSSIEHISEWWIAGTDYTRHWMGSGVSWSPDHTDITNYYLYMGILGGLPLMFLFMAMGVKAFGIIGRGLKELPNHDNFPLWALGSALFVHAVTCVSVAYFDQSVVFLYLTLGLIGAAESYSLVAVESTQRAVDPPLTTPVRLMTPEPIWRRSSSESRLPASTTTGSRWALRGSERTRAREPRVEAKRRSADRSGRRRWERG